MKISLRELRQIIVETIRGSSPDESYKEQLVDDPSYLQKSMMVPDDIKDSIGKWMVSMGLTKNKKRK